MLHNEPPAGTRVRLLREVQTADRTLRAGETALIGRALGTYVEEQPEDQFEVVHRGQYYVVERRDLMEA